MDSQSDCNLKILKHVARKYERYQMLRGLLALHLEQAGWDYSQCNSVDTNQLVFCSRPHISEKIQVNWVLFSFAKCSVICLSVFKLNWWQQNSKQSYTNNNNQSPSAVLQSYAHLTNRHRMYRSSRNLKILHTNFYNALVFNFQLSFYICILDIFF